MAITRQHLAESIGATLHTASRIIAQRHRDGLVESGAIASGFAMQARYVPWPENSCPLRQR